MKLKVARRVDSLLDFIPLKWTWLICYFSHKVKTFRLCSLHTVKLNLHVDSLFHGFIRFHTPLRDSMKWRNGGFEMIKKLKEEEEKKKKRKKTLPVSY